MDEWADVEEVNLPISIDIGLIHKASTREKRNQWADVEKVDKAVRVDISQQNNSAVI